MTERKFTDEEVIKALECCYTNDSNDCYHCPYVAESTSEMFCDKKLEKNALDLINRQKAEIDILVRKHDTLLDEIAGYQAEIESLKTLLKKKYAEAER